MSTFSVEYTIYNIFRKNFEKKKSFQKAVALCSTMCYLFRFANNKSDTKIIEQIYAYVRIICNAFKCLKTLKNRNE